MPADWRARLHRLERLHDAFFTAKWRAGLRREANRQEDVLMATLFLEALGVGDPTSYYALELYPHLVEGFHQWHRRMGIERFPDAGFCC